MGADATTRVERPRLQRDISRLEARGLIEPLPLEGRRRPYRITAAGAQALAEQSEHMSRVALVARKRLGIRVNWAGA